MSFPAAWKPPSPQNADAAHQSRPSDTRLAVALRIRNPAFLSPTPTHDESPSPLPSIEITVARSKGDAYRAAARWARWWCCVVMVAPGNRAVR